MLFRSRQHADRMPYQDMTGGDGKMRTQTRSTSISLSLIPYDLSLTCPLGILLSPPRNPLSFHCHPMIQKYVSSSLYLLPADADILTMTKSRSFFRCTLTTLAYVPYAHSVTEARSRQGAKATCKNSDIGDDGYHDVEVSINTNNDD